MRNKKISFIVPVYNVEKYLSRCLDSILEQTYRNFELIIINDGSPDESRQIIEEREKRDNRIEVINKKNEGVSAARNDGLKFATGEYILFVDGDDYIDKDYAEKILHLIDDCNADMAISYNYYDENRRLPEESERFSIIDSNRATEELYIGKIDVAVWNKIYKRAFLEHNAIIFDNKLWFAEGMTFNIECFQKAKKIVAGHIKAYHQVRNPESAVRKFNLKSWHCGMKAMKIQQEMIDWDNAQIKTAWQFHYHSYYFNIMRGIYFSHMDNDKKYLSEIELCKKELKHDIFLPFKVKISVRNKILWAIVTISPVALIRIQLAKQFLRNVIIKIANGGGV